MTELGWRRIARQPSRWITAPMVMVGVIVTGIHIWQRTDQAVQVPDHVRRQNSMNYIITGTDSAGALSLKRDSAAAAIKKAVERIGDGCREVCIMDPHGRIHSHAEFDQLRAGETA
jgi:hypothetical protein